MAILKLISLVLLVALLAVIIFIRPQKSNIQVDERSKALPEDYNNGAWMWESPLKIPEASFEEMMQFANEKNISTIYLYIEDYLNIVEDYSLDKDEKQRAIDELSRKIDQLLQIAAKYNVSIEALSGGLEWAESSHEYIPHLLMDYVTEFNAVHDVKFVGIQFDIEFYNLDNFEKNKISSTENYLDLVSDLKNKIAKENNELKIGFAIPYWFDDAESVIPSVLYAGKRQTVFEHMVEILEGDEAYLVLMAYRNEAKGEKGTIKLSENEIDVVNRLESNIKIYIGQETEANELEEITFYGDSQQKLNQETNAIVDSFKNYESFGGISVHTLKGYMSLSN